MRIRHNLLLLLLHLLLLGVTICQSDIRHHKQGKALSLFSIVQFPNQQCTGASSATTYGTCYTSSECTTKGGSGDGKCAAGFGVCCVIATSTCGSTISTNTTYIRNPGYPSGYKPTSAATCSFTINKVSDDICQLRLDFQTFTGFFVDSTTGVCADSLAVAGQTGSNPPTICGVNTGYHMYTEFGATSADSTKITLSYQAAGLTTEKSFNIMARQISCTATWKAPADCTQYFTGVSGNVQSYSYGQFLQSQYYTNCIRTEKGRCRIMWKQSSTSSPNSFLITGPTIAAQAGSGTGPANLCPSGYVLIPGLSMDGITGIPIPSGLQSFQSIMCGGVFGIEGNQGDASNVAAPANLVSAVQPFIVGVYSDTTTSQPATLSTGFNLDYTQLPC